MLESRRSFGVALVVFVFLLLAMWQYPESIPDWESYRKIYDNDGAWLRESGESSVFLFLMTTFKMLSPVASYEGFRFTLVFLFGGFMWLFLTGRVIDYPADRIWYVLLAFFVFGALRFTAQIREGIAAVLFLLSLGFLQRSALISEGDPRTSDEQNTPYAFVSWGLAIVAIGVHSSGIMLFLTRVFASVLARFSDTSKTFLFGLVWSAVILVIFAFVFGTNLNDEIISLALSRSGTRDLEAGFFTTFSFFYWVGNIGLWYGLEVLRKDVSSYSQLVSENLKILMATISGPLAALCLIAVFSLKAIGTTPIVTVLFVRAFDLMTSLSLLYIALFSRSKIGCLVATFVIAIKVLIQL